MDNFTKDNRENEIDLIEMLLYLRRKALIILGVAAVCALVGFFATKMFKQPVYTADTRMYVFNRTNDTAVVSADFLTSSYALHDYQVLITGKNVTKEVIEKLDLSLTPDQLSKKIVVTSPEDTRVLQVSVTDTSAKRAASIANCVREVAAEQISEIMTVKTVKTVYKAEVPKSPSGPNANRRALIAGAIGLIAAAAFYIVLFLLDDTIRSEADVTRYLGLSTLGSIPVSEELENSNSGLSLDKSRSSAKRKTAKRKK